MEQNQNPAQQYNNNRPRPMVAAAANQQQPPQQQPPAQPCPRCNSTNTKFCYYNNYSLSQPRYFCKGCRRYWTQGGTLRNVPVGGGSRKSKRPKLSTTTTTTTNAAANVIVPQQQPPPPPINSNSNNLVLPEMSNTPTAPLYSGPGLFSSLGFGPNLSLLHALGLPGFDNQQLLHHHQQQQQQRHRLFQGTENMGASSSSTNWNITSSSNFNNGENDNNNRSNASQWTDFPAGSGLDDP